MANTDYAVKTFIGKFMGNSRVSKIRKKLIEQIEVRLNFYFVILIFRIKKSKHFCVMKGEKENMWQINLMKKKRDDKGQRWNK